MSINRDRIARNLGVQFDDHGDAGLKQGIMYARLPELMQEDLDR